MPEPQRLQLLGLVGIASIPLGVQLLAGTTIASSWVGAAQGVAGQLGVTLPAALLVAVMSAFQLAAGAVLVRGLRGAPYPSVVDAALGGLVGAVLIGLVALMLLGGLGWFRPIALAALNGAVIASAWRVRPLVAGRPELGSGIPVLAMGFIGLAWAGSVILQLASPVVPFIDVLPNHVAPSEHLRAFGAFDVLTTAPSPIYGPSRMFLGYTGLLGSTTVLSGQPAALAVSAFILPSTLLVAAGVARLASGIHGLGVGWWMLLAFTLSESFARLADARATVIALALSAFCLVTLLEPGERARSMLLALGLAATLFFHPLIGVLTAAVIGVMVALQPDRYARPGIPAVVGAVILAIPQALTMVALEVPSALGLLVIPPGIGAAWLLDRSETACRWIAIGLRVVTAVAVIAVVGVSVLDAPRWVSTFADFFLGYPVLTLSVVVTGALVGRRIFPAVAVVAFGMGFLAVLAAAAMPWSELGIEGLDFEVTKTLHYWTPVFMAVMAAAGLRAVWLSPSYGQGLRTVVVLLVLLATTLPLRDPPIEAFHLGEHRVSETLSIDLRFAETGFWIGYPDTRTLIDADQEELIDRLRDEVEAGRLASTTPILHVAHNFQQWDATPIGVFGGMIETMISIETEVSSHTAGGRLHPFADLDPLLGEGFPYVVLEPEGLPADTRDRILAAGYEPIFDNVRGEILVRSGEVAPDGGSD
jgi:hypothetical protein